MATGEAAGAEEAAPEEAQMLHRELSSSEEPEEEASGTDGRAPTDVCARPELDPRRGRHRQDDEGVFLFLGFLSHTLQVRN